MFARVTAVLLNWRRPYHIPTIVESLRQHDFILQVVVVDNSGELGDIEGAEVMRCKHNFGTFGRYIGATSYAWNDVIYTQDDDIVVNNVPELLEEFQRHGEEKIVAGLSEGHYKHEWLRTRKPWLQLGWGSFHHREWLKPTIQKWIDRRGSRDQLLWSKFDRIYTHLIGPDRQHAIPGKYTALRGPDGRRSERDQNSLWLSKGHRDLVRDAREECNAILESEQ